MTDYRDAYMRLKSAVYSMAYAAPEVRDQWLAECIGIIRDVAKQERPWPGL